MDILNLKNLIIWMIFISGVQSLVKIESVDENTTITQDKDRYILSMDENNHNFHKNKALFKIMLEDCSNITISFYDKIFTNEVKNCIVYSLQSFDYENENQRTYSLLIIDGTNSNTQVRIDIRNIDDENPILTCPKCSLDENTNYDETNSTCKYMLQDPDGFLSYMTFTVNPGLANDDQIFDVKKVDGLTNETYEVQVPLINLITLDYETTTFYSFTVTVTDTGNNSFTQNAIVNVNDMRDTKPKWTKIVNFAEFKEKSIQLFQVIAVDGDTGIHSPICYKIITINDSQNHQDYDITINKNTGLINVNNIDRDKYDINLIKVTITACICEDDDWCTPQSLSYYIEDIDDHSPIIVKNSYIDGTDDQEFDDGEEKVVNVQFLENFSGSLNFSSFIQDIDTGENAQFDVELVCDDGEFDYTVAYLIVPTAGYKSGQFKISVKDAKYLDYENSTWKNNYFYVKSTGTFNSSHTDHMYVNISLIDYNDEIPTFDKASYIQSINETAKTGDFVLRAHAEDRDAEDKVLKMEIVGNYAEKRLRIDSDGNIIVNLTNSDDSSGDYYFDYDILNSVFFQVRAIDAVNHTTTVPVTLTILDVNNKAPMIDPVDPVRVEENQRDGIALNVTIKATDPYSKANLIAEIDWTKSYATKNSIRLNMDNETNQEVINFLEPKIIPEEGGREIQISLIVTNSGGKKPDFETFDSLYLNLVVRDLNIDPEFIDKDRTSENILIAIIDINDNPPYFPDSNNVSRFVQEEASEGTSVGFIQATDPDIGDIITYRCAPEEDDFDWVVIDKDSGAFIVKEGAKVNADDPPFVYKYTFKYECFANDGVHDSDPLPVEFNITDTNNKVPKITLNNVVSVVEKSPKGTEVAPIDTTDLDRDVPFHTVFCNFKFDPENTDCNNKFLITENDIMVQNGENDIDRDNGKPRFVCKVNCHDNPSGETSERQNYVEKEVTIELLDINDHAPTLITVKLEASENLEKEMKVGDIMASDIDYLENATIDFQIESILNNVTGVDIVTFFQIQNESDYIVNDTLKMTHLYTTKNLRGNYGEYIIQLKLQDEGNPTQTTNPIESRIKFKINKFNFKPPVIEFPKMNDVFLLLSTQDIGKPLINFHSGDFLNNFTAQDGETKNCEKWDVTFVLSSEDDYGNIFMLDQNKPCISQLQVTKQFESNMVINKPYNLELLAWINSSAVEPNPDEQPYFTSIKFTVKFLDNNQEPYFSDDSPWKFNFTEDDKTQIKPLRNKAIYDIDDDDLAVNYYLIGEQSVKDIFNVDRITGDISILKKFYYDDAQQYTFKILASKDTNQQSSLPNSYLDVTIIVLSINRRSPIFTAESFFGALMPTYKSGFPVVTITAHDPDAVDKGKLKYSIVSDITPNGDGLDNINDPPFLISTSNDVGKIESTFYVESSMSGHFVFTVMVEDVQDEWGHGPHNANTTTTIFIITSDNTVDFKFLNDVEEIQQRQNIMLEIVTKVLGYTAYLQNIKSVTEGAQTFTIATLYFIDSTSTTLITSEDILKKVANVNTFGDLAKQLKVEKLYLDGFPSPDSKVNTDAILRKWLLGVSVILGVFCLILLGALIWKTRQLNRRISKLTTKKFGSQDSGLNRLGVSAPTTNKHAIEGSNPVYKNDEIKKPKNATDFDTHSIRSGDSDLIGIENNPEFDYNFHALGATPVDKKTHSHN